MIVKFAVHGMHCVRNGCVAWRKIDVSEAQLIVVAAAVEAVAVPEPMAMDENSKPMDGRMVEVKSVYYGIKGCPCCYCGKIEFINVRRG